MREGSFEFGTSPRRGRIPAPHLYFARFGSATKARSMATFGFMQDGSKVSSDEGEALLDAPRYRQFGSRFRYPILPGKHPYRSRTIIDLESTPSKRAIGVDHPSRNRNLLTRIASGVSVYLGNAHARRAPGQQQDSKSEQEYKHKLGT
jgi:hypothetical protein